METTLKGREMALLRCLLQPGHHRLDLGIVDLRQEPRVEGIVLALGFDSGSTRGLECGWCDNGSGPPVAR